ncbi:hypothetical protein HY449_01660 [Candidatus Pacearchaeota archaeon]|nr:hypothetical protein [Candidatus Pacearchaeota archaeon]
METAQANETFRKGTLDELVSAYKIVLFDTSSILGYLNRKERGVSISDKINKSCFNLENTDFLHRYAENGHIYLTPEVVSESLANNSYSVKKRIRRRSSHHDSESLELIRLRGKCLRSLRRFVNSVELNQNIVVLNAEESEIYSNLKSKFNFIKSKYSLSETDFSIVLSGIVLSQKRGLTAIVSNDFGLLKSGVELAKLSNIEIERFGFFIRKRTDYFPSAIGMLAPYPSA